MINNIIQLKHFFSDRKGTERTETLETLNAHVNTNADTIHFSMLWCAGNKTSINQSDKNSLQYLFRFLKEVEKAYGKKAHLTLIFADTHAYLNGYGLDSMRSYFKEIQSVCEIEKYNYSFDFSSELCKKKIVKKGFQDFTHYIDDIIKNPESHFKQTGLPTEQVETFYQAARKHCKRTKQDYSGIRLNEKEAAMAYFAFANFERDVITENFFNSVFITYMTREEGGALPKLPIVRLYSIESGLRTRPWFID